MAAVPAALAGGQSAPARQWRVVARPPGFLDVIIAPAASSAWAFGWIGKSNGLIAPVARHWNGRRWASITMPRGVNDSGRACAGASSPGNVWAFSGAGVSLGNPPATASALRLRHGRWVLRKSFPGSYVTGCNVLSPRNVWVSGGTVAGLGPGVGTWHLTRSGWAPVNTGNLVLFKASVASANDIWATGADITDHGLRITPVVARWNGSAWVQHRSISAALPKPASQTGVSADAIKAFSPGSVWVQAFVEAHAGAIGVVVVHWNGRGWRRVNRPAPGTTCPTPFPTAMTAGGRRPSWRTCRPRICCMRRTAAGPGSPCRSAAGSGWTASVSPRCRTPPRCSRQAARTTAALSLPARGSPLSGASHRASGFPAWRFGRSEPGPRA